MPVAAGGAVFVSGPTGAFVDLFVLDERDGHIVYTAYPDLDGNLTLGGNMLFVIGGCHETKALDARTGTVLWHDHEDCYGAGDTRSVFHDGVLWVPDYSSPFVGLDATSGTKVATVGEPSSTYGVSPINEDLILLSGYQGNALKVFSVADGSLKWSVALPHTPQLPALVAPGYAFVLLGEQFQDKHLYAVNLISQEITLTSSDPAAPADVPWSPNGSEPTQGLAASGARIVVAYGRALTAFAPVSTTPDSGAAE